MPLKSADLAKLLADKTKKALAAGKAETVKEMKGLVAGMVAEKMGTGTAEYKTLAAAVLKEVLTMIPQASVFAEGSQAKNIDTRSGFDGMSKKAQIGRASCRERV